MRAVKASKNAEVRYRKALETFIKKLTSDVGELITPILNRMELKFNADSDTGDLEVAFDNLRLRYAGIDQIARRMAYNFVEAVDKSNSEKFYQSVAQTNILSIDLRSVINSENLSETLNLKTRENVSLIKSIPSEYFKKLEHIVYNGVVIGKQPKSMIAAIKELGYSTTKRARLIARDQTSKLNAALNQERATKLGITEYVWRTAGDERVRDTHAKNNGKIFRYDDPPAATGHPSHDIQCRCVAQPIIKT